MEIFPCLLQACQLDGVRHFLFVENIALLKAALRMLSLISKVCLVLTVLYIVGRARLKHL